MTTYVTDPFGDASFSAHRITDRNEELGDLLLVEPARAMTTAEVASALGDSIGSRPGDLTPVGTSEHSGMEVEHMRSSDADLYVWSDRGIVSLFRTFSHPADAEPFIDAYLAERAGTA